MSAGFGKGGGRRRLGAADLADRIGPVPVDGPAEERAVRAGEAKGFASREATGATGNGPEVPVTGRRRHRRPQGRILVAGPRHVLDRFIRYADDAGHSAYWNALEALMDAAEAAGAMKGPGRNRNGRTGRGQEET